MRRLIERELLLHNLIPALSKDVAPSVARFYLQKYPRGGACTVPAYRIYSFGGDGHIAGPPAVIECDSDAEIIAKAKELLNGFDIEVWDGPRIVAKVPSANRPGEPHRSRGHRGANYCSGS